MDIWGFDIEENLPYINISDLLPYVSPAKQKRIKAFEFHQDALHVLIGDLLVRTMVCRYLNQKNAEIIFRTNRYGKPYLDGAEGFHYNISHSGKWIVGAFDSEPVGIDVEAIKPVDLDIAPNLFSPEEVWYIMNYPEKDRTDHFYEIWTLKESYFKALGCGLSKHPKSVSLKIHGNANITVTDSVNHGRFLHLCKLDQGYCLAVCTCDNEIPDRINIIDLQWIIDGIL